MGCDCVYAWPKAELAVMGAEGAANIVFRREIQAASDPDKVRQEKIDEYRDKFANPYVAASWGYIDDVIEPRHTRIRVVQAFSMLQNKRVSRPPKKHGNIPL
jgi:propionyl-CoA carboxylase beta chain